ncbi:acyl-CoA thioesterase [Granulicoccus phenolivorans]|uniref:acyl-CoA thioesterase n=1 Tax=Granulicoccus phenolivorans TaxID=266854 RepID=UPI0003F91C61|nr:hotdog domain-containing protein [Granulicoccus phenolivorans]
MTQTRTDPQPVFSDDERAGRLSFRLAYGDCDVVGIAYFGIYLRWMERCYSTFLYANGIRSGEMQADLGIVTVGVSSGTEYLDTVVVYDELECRAVRNRIGSSSYQVGFEFTRNGQLVTTGQMTFACRNPMDFGKAEIPARLRELIESLPEPTGR